MARAEPRCGMLLGRATFARVMERTRPRIGLGRDFDRLWLGESVSAVGTQLTALAIPTLAIFQLHATAFDVGVLTGCTFAGYPLVGILGAPLIDRVARRSMLLVTNALRAAALATVPLAGAAGVVSLPQLAAVALIVSGCTALFDTAYQSVVPELVPDDQLINANARLEASQATATFVGPALAGWLIAAGGLASVIGATQARRITARLGLGPSLIVATTVEGLAWAIAPLGSVAPPVVVLGAAAVVSGAMTPVWNVNVVTLRQRIVAPH